MSLRILDRIGNLLINQMVAARRDKRVAQGKSPLNVFERARRTDDIAKVALKMNLSAFSILLHYLDPEKRKKVAQAVFYQLPEQGKIDVNLFLLAYQVGYINHFHIAACRFGTKEENSTALRNILKIEMYSPLLREPMHFAQGIIFNLKGPWERELVTATSAEGILLHIGVPGGPKLVFYISDDNLKPDALARKYNLEIAHH